MMDLNKMWATLRAAVSGYMAVEQQQCDSALIECDEPVKQRSFYDSLGDHHVRNLYARDVIIHDCADTEMLSLQEVINRLVTLEEKIAAAAPQAVPLKCKTV